MPKPKWTEIPHCYTNLVSVEMIPAQCRESFSPYCCPKSSAHTATSHLVILLIKPPLPSPQCDSVTPAIPHRTCEEFYTHDLPSCFHSRLPAWSLPVGNPHPPSASADRLIQPELCAFYLNPWPRPLPHVSLHLARRQRSFLGSGQAGA